jgi:hypothetical protein
MNTYREWRDGSKLLNRRQGGIGRSVIAYHQFMRQQCLSGEAVKLLADEELAIVGSHGD